MKILVAMLKDHKTETFMTPENQEKLASLGEVTWIESKGPKITPEELRDALEDMDVCVCTWGIPKFEGVVLEKANKLKLIAYTAGSVHNIVSDEMYEKGIRIVCGNEGFAESVAEGTMAYMMANLRRLKDYDLCNKNIVWRPDPWYSERLLDKTVGIVGYGSIARHLLRMLKPFHVKVKLYSKHTTEEQAAEMGVQKATLEEIFATCDIVSIHSARSAANYHLVTAEMLNSMREGALLVNTARGDIIDQEALIPLLQSGKIRASLDVYEGPEPLAMDSPFRSMPSNALCFPHMGGPTEDYRYYCALLTFQDIERMQKGEPLQNEIKPWRAAMMTK